MVFGLLVMLTALCISAVAIYYSVAGLAAIFAAAAIPIIIMGGVLEVSKLVTAVWLHRYWDKAVWWLKTYLSIAVVVLMFITSMGIFGYLSKAHIEQTSANEETIQQINKITTEITRYEAIIKRSEGKIKIAENAGLTKNDTIQDQIDREQGRIDTAYNRIQPLVAEQNKIIQEEVKRNDNKIKPYLSQVSSIDEDIATLSNLLNRRDKESIKRLQSIVGTRVDGTYGSKTASQVETYRDGLLSKRESILDTIRQLEEKESPLIIASKDEIKRLRTIAENEIADSNKLINKLREEIGKSDIAVPDTNEALIEKELLKIKEANTVIETLIGKKYEIEAEYRKLEAEVGPIKYIAEMIYGQEVDRDLLEEAVRWVIILIIFVFDPLAVLLLIASQYTFRYLKAKEEEEFDYTEYEKARAQKIVDNQQPKYEDVSDEELKIEKELEESTKYDPGIDKVIDNEIKKQDEVQYDEGFSIADDSTTALTDGFDEDEVAYDFEKIPEPDIERLTEEQIDQLDQHPLWTKAKRRWKDENPNRTIKNYKELYLTGAINTFPWEKYLDPETEEERQQISTVKETLKLPEEESVQIPINETLSSDSNQTTVDKSYIQNEEQNEKTQWRKLRDRDE